MMKIFLMNGSEKGKIYALSEDRVLIGRSRENHVFLSDKSVSRKHLEIIKRGDHFFGIDLGSTNGTFIGSKPMVPGKEYEIGGGVPIRLGNLVLSIGKALSKGSESREKYDFVAEDLDDTGLFNRPATSPKNLELIYKVSNALMESLDINTILEKVLHAIFELLKRIDRGAIILVDSKTGKISKVIAKSVTGEKDLERTFSRTIVQRVIRERRPVSFMDTLDGETPDPSRSMILMNIRSVMCVPLISRSSIRGVIYVDSLKKPYGFRKEDISLLIALSGPAAVAIENALLYADAEKLVEERTRSLKETERRLRKSEARFKAIFDNMRSGVAVFKVIEGGKDFLILDLNRANERIEKVRKVDVLGKQVSEVFPVLRESGLFEVFRNVWRTGKPEHYSLTFQQDREKMCWREYDVYRLPSGEIVAIFDDVTDKRKAEEEQKALQRQLLVSQKMESIGAFAGGTAHNFRNILQAISGNVEYLELLYGENQEVKELAKNIYDSVEKGVDLINNLLHFSRRGDGYQITDVDLSEVISKTCEIIKKVFDKNIEIRVNLEKGLFVAGNQSLLSQVFMNLFTNARDAMPGGGVLAVEAKRVNGRVVARVRDTGHGMDQETIEKVFDPFFTLKEVGKGTGLGLSTTHGIIEEHKGTISVSSKPGEGTEFTITLPPVKPSNVQEEKPPKQLKMGQGQKILIVDDEPTTLEALSNLTRSLGYQTIPFEKPLEAVRNYPKVAPDLVLMDRSMPEMDGLACINEIMKTDQN